MESFDGKVAVVTGGASGIGRSLALAFAREGAHIVVADVEVAGAEAVRDEVLALGVRSIAAQCNVADFGEVEALAAAAYAEFGAVHLLCNNAGVVQFAPLAEVTPADWTWLRSVNLDGVMNGVMAFVPRMVAQGGPGHILNTASIAGLSSESMARLGMYVATKYAVVGLSEVLRGELAPSGIGVSVLCPGGVVTRIIDAGRNRPRELGGPFGSPVAAASGIQMQGMAPDDVAALVLAGVRANQLYVPTHPETRPLVEARHANIAAAFDALAARGQG
ncbi:MAG: SDR family NAD(P)-dependent oxidoreductase [Dehalococcoidia bacterium]|nr:SDR family NAD(P)-dependent oxidoreductase [Dehalococcoidia bacterium]